MARNDVTGHWAGRPPQPGWPTGSLLDVLGPDTRQELLGLGRVLRFEAGETVLRQGEPGRHVFLLLHGWFKVLAADEEGRVALVAIRAGGDVVGELACFDDRPRMATVTAVGPCLARRIRGPQFLDFLAAHQDASRAVLHAMAEKVRWATRRMQDFAGCPVPVRVCRVLVELVRDSAQGAPGHWSVVLTQPDLAALVGASEASVQRALRGLRSDGVISTGYGRIVVERLDLLCLATQTRPLEGLAGLPAQRTGRPFVTAGRPGAARPPR